MVGLTDASNFPTTPGAAYRTASTAANGFIARIDPLASPPNTPPTISNVTDRVIAQNTSTGAIGFTIGDAETPSSSLRVSASSPNTALVPLSSIVFGGSGAARTVAVTPVSSQSGNATITLTVSDGSLGASDTFELTVGLPPPSSVDDSYGTAINSPLTVAAPGVLGNDNPNTGGAMTAAVVIGPLQGG